MRRLRPCARCRGIIVCQLKKEDRNLRAFDHIAGFHTVANVDSRAVLVDDLLDHRKTQALFLWPWSSRKVRMRASECARGSPVRYPIPSDAPRRALCLPRRGRHILLSSSRATRADARHSATASCAFCSRLWITCRNCVASPRITGNCASSTWIALLPSSMPYKRQHFADQFVQLQIARAPPAACARSRGNCRPSASSPRPD